MDDRARSGKNCTLALYQPDRWRGFYLEPINLGLEGDAEDPLPVEPLRDQGCPAGYRSCETIQSLSSYRPQRYGDHIMEGKKSDDPLVEEALKVLSYYLSDSYDKYQEAIVYG